MIMETVQADPAAETAATAVKVVELSRGDAPAWSILNLLTSIRDFNSSHILLVVLAAFGIIALATWLIMRKHGAVGVAGVLLLTGLALRGHLRSIRRIIRQARQEKISLAAAALADD